MASAYSGGELVVLDARRLMTAYLDRIRLCHMNSGATSSPYHYRGYATCCRIEDYPYWKRRKKVAEVRIDDGVPDIVRFVQLVRQLNGSTWEATIYYTLVSLGCSSYRPIGRNMCGS